MQTHSYSQNSYKGTSIFLRISWKLRPSKVICREESCLKLLDFTTYSTNIIEIKEFHGRVLQDHLFKRYDK